MKMPYTKRINVEKSKKKNMFKNISLKTKLLLFFVFISFIPTITIGIISYKISESIIFQREIENNIRNLEYSKAVVSNYLQEELNSGLKLATNPYLISILQAGIYGTETEEQHTAEIIQIFDEYSSYRSICSIYLFDEHGNMITNDKSRSINYKSIISNSWYPETISEKKYIWGEPKKPNGENVIPLYLVVINPNDGKEIGLILINIYESYIYYLYSDFIDPNGETLLLNENSTILSSKNKYQLRMSLHDVFKINDDSTDMSGSVEKKVANEQFLITYYKDTSIHWTYLSIKKFKVIVKDIEGIKHITWILCSVCLFVTTIFALFLSLKLTKPLKKLVYVMEKVNQGNLNISTDFNSEDEIGLIGKAFDHMIGELKESIANIYIVQNKMRKNEIKILQEQINPHFLYNTLTSIIWLANGDKKKEVIQMVSSLSKFFRISLSNGKEIITLEEEMEQVRHYLIIQNIRYKDQFEFVFNIIGDIGNLYVSKLILQPLVENSIYHGVSKIERKGTISIKAFRDSKTLILEVADNGKGMEDSKIEFLNNTLSCDALDSEFGVGIRNVNSRIKLLYGNEYGLQYRKETEWIIAKITLPIVESLEMTGGI